MTHPLDMSGTAALAICESLLLALNDHGVLPKHEIIGLLEDAAAAHAPVPGDTRMTDAHAATSLLINRIMESSACMRNHPAITELLRDDDQPSERKPENGSSGAPSTA